MVQLIVVDKGIIISCAIAWEKKININIAIGEEILREKVHTNS